MIDYATLRDGSIALMARGRCLGVPRIATGDGTVRVTDSGRPIAETDWAVPFAVGRANDLAQADRLVATRTMPGRPVTLILAGPGGLAAYEGRADAPSLRVISLADALGRFGPGTSIIADPAGHGAWHAVNIASATIFAVASSAAEARDPALAAAAADLLQTTAPILHGTRGQDAVTAHRNLFRSVLGTAAQGLAESGPLAAGRMAELVAQEIELELEAGLVPVGFSMHGARLSVELADAARPGLSQAIVFAANADGEPCAIRFKGGKVAAFGPGRPSVRMSDAPDAGGPIPPARDVENAPSMRM